MLNRRVADPVQIYGELVRSVVAECEPGTGIETIEKIVRQRLRDLPSDVREAIEEAGDQLVSFSAPGFHENGPH